MDEGPSRRLNPFVGPRALQYGETLYGRRSEVLSLLDLLIAERIVLFYAPSGAGKTSLIQAGLVPELAEEAFRVWPGVASDGSDADAGGTFVRSGSCAIRLNQRPPDNLKGVNRYVLSMLVSLEEVVPSAQQLPLDRLVGMTLSDYLAHRIEPAPGIASDILIFDQFEEVLTVDPTDRAAKEEFFSQLGGALRDRSRWALFAMREEYIAGLDSFRRLVPTHFDNTFRIDLLEEARAREVMQKLSDEGGVEFTDNAARRLADDLRTVKVQTAQGSMEERLGPFVEPVQLQVICRQLWDRLPEDERAISEADVEALGDVDHALASYYAQTVATVAKQVGIHERWIRRWFDLRLITQDGLRAQVMLSQGGNERLDNAAVQRLVDAHLVRGERRRGVTWFELVHDRLIQPVRDDNAAWRAANLSVLQQAALVWNEKGRPPGLLLGAGTLKEAESWAGEHGDELLPTEKQFLQECRNAREAREHEAAQTHRIRRLAILAAWLAVLASAVAAVAVVFFFSARTAEHEAVAEANKAQNAEDAAKQRARESHARQLAATAVSLAGERLDLALLLSLEARRIHDNPEVRGSLPSVLARSPELVMYLHEHRDFVTSVEFSPDGKLLASGDLSGDIIVRDALTGYPTLPPIRSKRPPLALAFQPEQPRLASGHLGGGIVFWDLNTGEPIATMDKLQETWSLAFSPDGRSLASGNGDGTVVLWGTEHYDRIRSLRGHEGQVLGVAFSPNGNILASGGADGTVRLWNPQTGQQTRKLEGHKGCIYDIAFSPDGDVLASVSTDQTIRLWDPATGGLLSRPLTGHRGEVTGVAFGPTGRLMATVGSDKTARLWDLASDPPIPWKTLAGHSHSVHTVAFSPDGRLLATGGLDKKVILWDPNLEHRHSQWYPGAPYTVRAIAFSRDGRILASAATDSTIVLWNAATRQRLGTPLVGHESGVTSLAFSPTGRVLASGSFDKTIRLWNTDTGEPVAVPIRGHKDSVLTVIFSPDGKSLASGGRDGTVRIWNVATASAVRTLEAHEGTVWSVAFSPDGRTLVSGGADGSVVFWDAGSGQQIRRLPAHKGAVIDVAFSADGEILATGGTDNAVRLWDAGTGELRGPLVGHTQPVWAVAFAPTGHLLASAGRDRAIRLWDASTGEAVEKPLTGHSGNIHDLAFSPGGGVLASADTDGSIILWDARTGKQIGDVLRGHGKPIWSVALSPDGKLLAVASADPAIDLWDYENGQGRGLLRQKTQPFSLAFSADSAVLVAGNADGTIHAWDFGGRAVDELSKTSLRGFKERHEGAVNSVAISPTGGIVATGGRDKTVRLWRLADGEPLRSPLKAHDNAVSGVAFNRDGSKLASVDTSGRMIVWDVPSGTKHRDCQAHNFTLNAVAFSPSADLLAVGGGVGDDPIKLAAADNGAPFRATSVHHGGNVYSLAFGPSGRLLASGSEDNTVRLWDVTTGDPFGPPLGAHGATVSSVSFSHDGKTLVSAGGDGLVHRWNIDPASWRRTACEIADRNLTGEEWETYFPGEPYREICADGLLREADLHALEGRESAAEEFKRVVQLAAETQDADMNNGVCWRGSIGGYAETVLPACNRAVVLAPETTKPLYRDTRAIALALTGDYVGAIEDLRSFLEWLKDNPHSDYERLRPKRERWVRKLEGDNNPFDEATLRDLRRE